MGDEETIDLSNFDFSKKRVDPLEKYIEELGEPLWTRTITVAENDISLVNYNPEFDLTEEYMSDLRDVTKRLQEVNPDLLKKCKRIIFDPTQPVSRYDDETAHPFNGTRLSDGILLYKNGQRRDIPHRTGVTNNFQGTIAHEAFHSENNEVDALWKRDFGWEYCAESPDLWEKTDAGRTTFRNRQTGEVSNNGIFTSRPAECVTDYARQAWDDDYADSGVVALYDEQKLIELNPRKLEVIQRKMPVKGSS